VVRGAPITFTPAHAQASWLDQKRENWAPEKEKTVKGVEMLPFLSVVAVDGLLLCETSDSHMRISLRLKYGPFLLRYPISGRDRTSSAT
jgi:hypothetical protein